MFVKHFSFCEIGKSDDSHNNGLNLLVCNMLSAIASHPTWVCGLKQYLGGYAGGWGKSHPTWVCGLKQVLFPILRLPYVTPYVGVWIETHEFCFFHPVRIVTPYVGVWIETSSAFAPYGLYARHTLRGCVD